MSEPAFPKRVWFIGFAGHRDLPDREAAKTAIARELELVAASVPGEPVALASAAAGADLLFLQAARAAGMKTIVLLPFARDRFSEDFENPDEWQAACLEMDEAWWCEVSPGGEEAPAAYHVVARETLDLADRMLVLWNGLPARGLGGTAETVSECADRGIPCRVIDANTFEPRWNGSPPHHAIDDLADLPAATDVQDLFEKLDERAKHLAPLSRWFSAGSLSLNQLATVLQVVLVALALAAAEAGALMKFLIVTAASLMTWIGGKIGWQNRWVRDRVRAELLRSLIASHEPSSPLHPPALELFSGEKALLRTVALHLLKQRKGWQQARDAYVGDRIDGQLRYLQKHADRSARRLKHFRLVFWIASWGAMIFGGYAVTTAYLHTAHRSWDTVVDFSAAVMPAVAAWCLAMISAFELKRRASLYRQLIDELKRLRTTLMAANSASAVTRAMHQIERLLLNELWEWQGSRKK